MSKRAQLFQYGGNSVIIIQGSTKAETLIEIYDLDGKLLEKDKISDYGHRPNNQMILQIEECLYYLKFECKKVNEHTNCLKVMKFKLDTKELSIHLVSHYNPDSSSGGEYINYTTQNTR